MQKVGIAEYKYYLGEELKATTTTSTYKYEGLIIDNTYILKVIVTDNAGNETEKTTTITTRLTAGNFVFYIDPSGLETYCMVLYDEAYNIKNGTNYGIQIVTLGSVEQAKISDNTLNGCMNVYNNAITIFNSIANEYLNTKYATSARALGTVPDNPTYESTGYFVANSSYSYMSSYNGKFKNADSNYETDLKQVETIGAAGVCTFASRYITSDAEGTSFGLRSRWHGELSEDWVFHLYDLGGTAWDGTLGYVYACFTLKPDIKITGGDGTASNPYTME